TGSVGTKSLLEDAVVEELELVGAPRPMVNRRVTLGSERPELDLYWPRYGVVGDVIGAGHDRRACRVADANLASLCDAAGLLLVPVHQEYVSEGVQRIASELEARGASMRPRSAT
ncbi:MAG: hypothetical protein JWM86_472, partial [Thermoleophilia bacterium]|nr:hypothetical protein [Thermoleophilia bacterium]